MKITQDEMNLLRTWRAKPEVFFRDVLKWKPWEKQVEILHSVRDNKETFVKSCNAAGKSWLGAGLVIYWLATREGKVVTTAPTWRQVKSILWSKIGSQCSKAPHLGLRPMQTRLDVAPDWFAEGLSTRTPDRFQGYHNNVLIVVDEAGGVDNDEIWGAIAGNLTDDKNDRLLAIGNPTNIETPFGRMCTSKVKGRKVITISAYDVPNVKQGKEVVPGLITKPFVEARLAEWGIDNPLFQARILGEFPPISGDSMFPMAWMDRAFNYDTSDEVWDENLNMYVKIPNPLPDLTGIGGSAIGFDVAAGGADNNALCYRVGNKVVAVRGWKEIDTSDLVYHQTKPSLYGWIDNFMPETVHIDSVGPGQIIYRYALKHKKTDERYKRLKFRPFIAQKKAIRENNYANAKAEAYWHFRQLLSQNLVDLSSITGDMRMSLEKQAASIKWKPDNKGRIQVESKEKLRAQHGWSPDELESIIMSFYGSSSPAVSVDAVASFDYTENRLEEKESKLVKKFDYDYNLYARVS